MLARRVALLVVALVGVAACGVGTGGDGGTAAAPAVPLGSLPPTFVPIPLGSTPPSTTTTLPRTTVPIPADALAGARAEGNRVILLGDSVSASTSRRYTNDMCEALVPLGWRVELNAETGRFVEFGHDVLDERLAEGWDVGVILLGNNYRGDPLDYGEELEGLIERLSPGRVVLLTGSEFDPSRAEVNAVVFEMAQRHDNVLLVDWGATTAANPALTGADGLHLTDSGRAALAAEVALAMGPAPQTPGKCLDTEYVDDSNGPVDGTTTTTTIRRTNRTPTTATTDPPPPTTDPPDTDPPTT